VGDCQSEQQLFLEIRNNKYLVFVLKKRPVLFEVGIKSLNSVYIYFRSKMDLKNVRNEAWYLLPLQIKFLWIFHFVFLKTSNTKLQIKYFFD